MKKITLLFVLVFISFSSFAENWGFWGATRSYVTVGGTEKCLYDNALGDFNNHDFGSVTVGTALNITSIYANTWKSGSGNVTGIEYFYVVYITGNRPSSPSFVNMNVNHYMYELSGTGNQRWGNDNISINIADGLTAGNYTLEIYGYLTGTGDSSDPVYDHGVDDGTNTGTYTNYKATFTVTDTQSSVATSSSLVKISGTNGKISAEFDGIAKVQLYSISGKLIRSENAVNQFTESVNPGIYVLRVNGTTYKVIAK